MSPPRPGSSTKRKSTSETSDVAGTATPGADGIRGAQEKGPGRSGPGVIGTTAKRGVLDDGLLPRRLSSDQYRSHSKVHHGRRYEFPPEPRGHKGEPQLEQNFAPGRTGAPQRPHATGGGVPDGAAPVGTVGGAPGGAGAYGGG